VNKFDKSWVATIGVAVLVCLVCAIIVSYTATALRPLQQINALADKQKNILQIAGIYQEGVAIAEQFKKVTPHLVEIDSGQYSDKYSVDSYDALKAAKSNDNELSTSFNQLGVEDQIKIGRRENYSIVYTVNNEVTGIIEKVILPIRGYGLWSTMYGYIAIDPIDLTVAGFGFYDQKETPGLGGEVDNPSWKSQWIGKKVYTDRIADGGEVAIQVLKGKVNMNAVAAQYQVDGLSGATITAKGVDRLVRFWLGDNGFKKFLSQVESNQI